MLGSWSRIDVPIGRGEGRGAPCDLQAVGALKLRGLRAGGSEEFAYRLNRAPLPVRPRMTARRLLPSPAKRSSLPANAPDQVEIRDELGAAARGRRDRAAEHLQVDAVVGARAGDRRREEAPATACDDPGGEAFDPIIDRVHAERVPGRFGHGQRSRRAGASGEVPAEVRSRARQPGCRHDRDCGATGSRPWHRARHRDGSRHHSR